MKKLLATAAFLTLIATPAFGQAFDPDIGTGNIASPLVMNQGGGSAYAYAPGDYERGYVRPRHAYRFRTPHPIDRDNTSVPGQGVDKDDTTPKSR